MSAVDPGPTATDMARGHGTQTLEEGTDAILTAATRGPEGPTGTYLDRSGALPW